MSRARDMRAARRAQQFGKFRVTQLNLVPLVDTFVSIVFFTLTTTTVGELAPVVPGVTLPETTVGTPALSQLTLGVGATVTLANRPIMNTLDAAAEPSNDARHPLKVPTLYRAMKTLADSLRRAKGLGAEGELKVALAIQGDKTMRYDLLSRFMATARLAGFTHLSLQVQRVAGP
ncbi:MAG TPA: biopolymer transporter ExbD [Gemmatimonadaceae bacterium]|jgi:biopolymer transport protein ExbD